jgi:predicted cupin superfamily sugar epimerase
VVSFQGRDMPTLDVDTLVETLRLEPHPEGGWYREVHRAPQTREQTRGPRAACTAIHNVLPGDSISA